MMRRKLEPLWAMILTRRITVARELKQNVQVIDRFAVENMI